MLIKSLNTTTLPSLPFIISPASIIASPILELVSNGLSSLRNLIASPPLTPSSAICGTSFARMIVFELPTRSFALSIARANLVVPPSRTWLDAETSITRTVFCAVMSCIYVW